MEQENMPKADLRTISYIVYGCWAAGLLGNVIHIFSVLPLVALIVALIKQKEAAGTIYESHFIWVVRTFVIGLVAAIGVAVLMILPPIGIVALIVLELWCLWRLIKGGLRIFENKPIEDPKAFY